MSEKSISVAVAQLVGGPDVESNLQAVEAMSVEAAQRGADIVVFPEATMFDFTATAERIAEAALLHALRFEDRVQAIAAANSIAVVVGTYAVGTGTLARNMMLAFGPDGAPLGRYQKLHLYDAFHYKESEKNEPAPLQPDFGELVTFDHAGFRFGLLNCYDLRFPEMTRLLVDRGAEILLVASGWVAGPLKEYHWETLLKARAIESTAFVAASCQPAPLSVGLSMIVDPNGIPIASVPEGTGLAIAQLDGTRIQAVRDVLPCLEHRRYVIRQDR
ncbi:carbon-nitrogen hydrolase family protein [Mesorhizobium sp. SB112]|uniref:carbon-nitrogen hydrolase family protein n=1 Tax=Mesorhizobium sp. SB112 TaxID=3151853 RepID=UPI003266B51A